MATQTTLQIAGMDCSHCAQRLGSSLERVDGVIKAKVDEVGIATIRYDDGRLSEDDLAERVRAAGFDGYLPKPCQLRQILAEVDRHLQPPAVRDGATLIG